MLYRHIERTELEWMQKRPIRTRTFRVDDHGLSAIEKRGYPLISIGGISRIDRHGPPSNLEKSCQGVCECLNICWDADLTACELPK